MQSAIARRAPSNARLVTIAALIVLMYTLLTVTGRVFSQRGLPRYRRLSAELLRLEHENTRGRQEIQDLQQRVEQLRADPEALEYQARREFGFVRPDETVLVFDN